jgi:protein ImuB
VERFGAGLLFRLDQAHGLATEMIVPYRPPPRYQAACELEYPTARRDILERLAAGLLERIVAELHARNVGAVRLVGRFECGPESVAEFEIGLFRPSDSEQQLIEMLRLQWERLALPGPVRRMDLIVEKAARVDWQPGEMFFGESGAAGPHLTALLERLSNRLGPRAVVRTELMADAVPERSFRYATFLGSRRRGSRAAPAAVSHRPLLLLHPPPRIEVEVHTSPTSFCWHSRWHEVSREWGPERIETAWWRGGTVRRDYYRVETTEGNRFWLFRDRNTRAWHLHGSFE